MVADRNRFNDGEGVRSDAARYFLNGLGKEIGMGPSMSQVTGLIAGVQVFGEESQTKQEAE